MSRTICFGIAVATTLMGCTGSQPPRSVPTEHDADGPPVQVERTEPPEHRRIQQGAWQSNSMAVKANGSRETDMTAETLDGYDEIEAIDPTANENADSSERATSHR